MEETRTNIEKLLRTNKEVFEDAFLRRFPSDTELADIEERLGLKIPEDYVWFLRNFGHGGFFFELLGYGLNGKALFAEKTLQERAYGLPGELLVIESMDEYVVCIDTLTNQVVTWSKHDRDDVIMEAESFLTYFSGRIQNAIENY